ncbi:O-antigen ligase family protein [Candidatus Viridilinea mediisalina]|uniref:O-antigen ligase family protein n=1 Tax=Candidatus Viridilinea mediisalina TaxID=2024553 RepID=UPI0013FE0C6B|nr:O-antigen ligase family protein [Candidatus Viridilinea mediisalina]
MTSVEEQQRRAWLKNGFFLLWAFGFIAIMALVGMRNGPQITLVAWLIFFGVLFAIFYNPRYGVYCLLGFTLVSDIAMLYWYPFVKNFSSEESIFFVSNALIFNPVELCIVLTAVSWLARMWFVERKLEFTTGPLFWPVLVFIIFITLGLAVGIVRGGNLNIALWETRAIYCLPALLFFVTNLIKTKEQLITLFWCAIIALFVKSIAASIYVATVLNFAIGSVDRIAEHAMSIQFNSIIVLTVATLLFKGPMSWRIVLPLMVPTLMLGILGNNRRSGFIALGLALFFVMLILYFDNRKLFAIITPPLAVFCIVYLAVFWNSSGPVSLPVNAVRSVLGQANERDASSNLYRELENANTMFTIQQAPLTGVGFGRKFYIIAPMADISFFVFWEYITHNSMLWIWMKAGVGAFLAMIYMISWSLMMGARVIRTMPNGELRTIAVGATMYILMHFVFGYVDMCWDTASMVYIGSVMGMINILPQIAAQPAATEG